MTEDSDSLEPDLSGQVLDRYRLVRRLGAGGMGVVYEAEHTALEKRVAIKLLLRQFAQHDVPRKRFLREAKAAAKVKHPNVVDISDYGETSDGRAYFAMELLAGRDLRALLEQEQRLPWARTQKLLLQVASALEAAHAQGIIHRDIKPSNCFLVDVPGLDEEDFIKVLDFGIAKYSPLADEETQGLTFTHELLGTASYMAPEMALGVSNDPRSDIYAVGVMLYRMMVGELPFKDGTAFLILAKHVNEAPPRPTELVPSVPQGVEAIILKALAKDPEDRFASMKDLRLALQRGGLADDTDAPAAEPTLMLGTTAQAPAVDKTEVLGSALLEHPTSADAPEELPEPTHRNSVVVVAPPDADSSLPEPSEVARLEPIMVDDPQRRRFPLLYAALAGLLAIGGAVWLGQVLANPPDEAADAPVAVAAPSHKQPVVGARPEPRVPSPSPPPPEPTDEPDELTIDPEPEEAAGPETDTPPSPSTEPAAEPQADPPETEPPPATPKKTARKPKKPRSDKAVVQSVLRKIQAKCRAEGGPPLRVEGIIKDGGVSRVLITPSSPASPCIKKLVKAAKFAADEAPRPMPIFTVTL